MRLNVTFRTTLPVDKAAHPVGAEMADYLKRRFSEAGIRIENVENYEDFAWSLDTTQNGKELFILVGYVGDGDYEWLLQINEGSNWPRSYTKHWRPILRSVPSDGMLVIPGRRNMHRLQYSPDEAFQAGEIAVSCLLQKALKLRHNYFAAEQRR